MSKNSRVGISLNAERDSPYFCMNNLKEQSRQNFSLQTRAFVQYRPCLTIPFLLKQILQFLRDFPLQLINSHATFFHVCVMKRSHIVFSVLSDVNNVYFLIFTTLAIVFPLKRPIWWIIILLFFFRPFLYYYFHLIRIRIIFHNHIWVIYAIQMYVHIELQHCLYLMSEAFL
jgi:hypothetical protein